MPPAISGRGRNTGRPAHVRDLEGLRRLERRLAGPGRETAYWMRAGSAAPTRRVLAHWNRWVRGLLGGSRPALWRLGDIPVIVPRVSADASWLESMPDVNDQHLGTAQQMVARLGEGPVRGDLTALMVSAQHRA